MLISISTPGKRLAKVSSRLFLNSALAGTPATTLLSFLAASMVFSHSICHASLVSAAADCCAELSSSDINTTHKTMRDMLLENLFGDLGRLRPVIIDRVFAIIFQPAVFFDGQKIFRRAHAMLDHPFGLDVKAARRLSHRFAVNLLAFLAEEPVDENFGRIRVR